MDQKTVVKLRGWMQKYGNGGTLLAGGYLVLHSLRTQRRMVCMVHAIGLVGLCALLYCILSGPKSHKDATFRRRAPSPIRSISSLDANAMLLDAAHSNSFSGVQAALAAGADVNTTDGTGYTALMFAVDSDSDGNHEIIRLLYARGAQLENYDAESTPLAEAALHHHTDTIDLLLALGAHIDGGARCMDGTALTQVAREGDLTMVKFLVAHGANVNAVGHDESVLQASVEHPEIVRFLLKRGATVNVSGTRDYTPLLDAAWCGNVESVRLLLAHGANVNHLSSKGETALTLAATAGHIEVVRTLLQRGADVELRLENQDTEEPGKTALQAAKSHGQSELVRLLQRAGARK